jgi:pyruvoyl-dependent arginine decarboxylase (PvlArgDC)
MSVQAKGPVEDQTHSGETEELRSLFHRLNNELGIILSHAELLEAKSADEVTRSRAAQVITSVLGAMATTREIRSRTVIEPGANGLRL